MTGRGRGNCLFGSRREESGSFGIRKRDGLGLAIAGMIVNEIANPDGFTRKLIQGVTPRMAGFFQAHKSMTNSTERQQISNSKLPAASTHDGENST